MNTEMIQASETENINDNSRDESLIIEPTSESEAVIGLLPAAEEDAWQNLQSQTAHFFANAPDQMTAFFRNNRQVLSMLGWILLAVLGVRIMLAALDTIDDLPLVAFLLKLIGLVYVVQFTRRYLMRASDRQELSEKIDQVKSDLLGSRS